MAGKSLQWRHNERDCLPNRLFMRRSNKTLKLRVSGFCERNSPVNSPHNGVSNADNVSIWWRHHES